MRRPTELPTRRDLIKSFGLAAFFIHPTLRNMAYAAPVPFEKAPRYLMFFKGGAYFPARTNPTSLANLAGTPIAPLQAHASDIILFKNMSIHGGSPKSDGYKEEHAAGVIGCSTGHRYKYSSNDAYFAYTDNESIDIKIANHYKQRADLADIPIASLHVGGGAHSDADQVGVGNRFISFRKRQPGDKQYGNAIEPIQNSGQVFDMLIKAAAKQCQPHSRQPASDAAKLAAATSGDKWLTDYLHQHAKDLPQNITSLGVRREFTSPIEDIFQAEKAIRVSAKAEAQTAAKARTADAAACATTAPPGGDGHNKKNLDDLSPVHDQMISLIKLAFQLDLTRVAAFTLSGGSSGQTWPSRGVHRAHHSLEHSGDAESLVKIDTYYSEKFANLLTALKSVDDGGGRSALYNSSVFLGMECWSNSSSGHYLTNIPFIFAGQGGGRFKTGQIINAGGRNNNDLHISCQNAAGIDSNVFGLESLCKGPII